jgi:anti-sigma factor RsiW
MLEADPEELAGQRDSELADHIAQCSRCGAVAAEILAGQALLAAGIKHVETVGGVDAMLPAVRRVTAQRNKRRMLARFAVPLAAAAAFVLLVLGDREPAAIEMDPSVQLATSRPLPEQTIRLSPNTNAVVFKTSNPKITVVWFY